MITIIILLVHHLMLKGVSCIATNAMKGPIACSLSYRHARVTPYANTFSSILLVFSLLIHLYGLISEKIYGKITTQAFQNTNILWIMAYGSFQIPSILPIVLLSTNQIANSATLKKW